MFSNRIWFSLVLFLTVISIIIIIRPSFMFDENNNVRSFGLENSKTLFSFGLICIVLPFLIFYLISFLNVHYYKKSVN